MEELYEVQVGAGRARFAWDYGIAHVNVSGVLAPNLYWRVASELADVAEHLPTFSAIVRTDQAVLAVACEAMLDESMLTPERWKHLRVPVAWVVDAVNRDLAVRHAWQCAERGIERAVFTEFEPAFSWAQEVARRALAPPRRVYRRSVAGVPVAPA